MVCGAARRDDVTEASCPINFRISAVADVGLPQGRGEKEAAASVLLFSSCIALRRSDTKKKTTGGIWDDGLGLFRFVRL